MGKTKEAHKRKSSGCQAVNPSQSHIFGLEATRYNAGPFLFRKHVVRRFMRLSGLQVSDKRSIIGLRWPMLPLIVRDWLFLLRSLPNVRMSLTHIHLDMCIAWLWPNRANARLVPCSRSPFPPTAAVD